MKIETKEQRNELMWRWSLISGLAILVYWVADYYIAGELATISHVNIYKDVIWTLPFAIPRLYDFLIGPIITTIIIQFIYYNDEEPIAGLVQGVVLGFVFWLVYGLGFGLTYGIVFGFGLGLVYGVVYGFGFGFKYGFGFGLRFVFGFGLVYEVVFGLGFGLVYGLGFGLGYGVVAMLVSGAVFKYILIHHKPTILRIQKWITASDVS